MRLLVLSPALAATLLLSAQAPKRAAPTKPSAEHAPNDPMAIIDTTGGRLTCRLFDKAAPTTTAAFLDAATGAKDWIDPATSTVQHGKPFYDGNAIIGVTDGIAAGDRIGDGKGTAGPGFPTEKSTLSTARAGTIGLYIVDGQTSSSRLAILEHADLEYKGRIAPFGLCDDVSVARIAEISHALLAAGNRPATPVAINHITIVKPGDPIPAPSADVLAASIEPLYGPEPSPALPAPEATGPTTIIDTTMGPLTCRLFKETSTATNNFIGLATGAKDWRNPATHANMHGKPFYTGLHFDRVIPDFMIEQGDLPGDHTGDGKIGFQFPNEIVPGLAFDRPGRLAYANSGPTTNASAFFVTEHPQHRLDGNYTIFGQCDEASVKVVEAIARVPRDAHNEPLKPVTVKSITIH
jgi:cyclophilin family peptidyl-prolyl cis-trans isomerase